MQTVRRQQASGEMGRMTRKTASVCCSFFFPFFRYWQLFINSTNSHYVRQWRGWQQDGLELEHLFTDTIRAPHIGQAQLYDFSDVSLNCALTSLVLDVSQLQTVFHLQYTIMTRKYLACHDKLANIAFCEQPEEFELAQPRLVQTVKFDNFSPISFVSQIHILSRKGHIGQVYGHC